MDNSNENNNLLKNDSDSNQQINASELDITAEEEIMSVQNNDMNINSQIPVFTPSPVPKKPFPYLLFVFIPVIVLVLITSAFFIVKFFFARDIMQKILGPNKYYTYVESRAFNSNLDFTTKELDKSIKLYNSMLDNPITQSGQYSMNLELTPMAKSLITSETGSEKELDAVIDFINGLKFNYKSTNDNNGNAKAFLGIDGASGRIIDITSYITEKNIIINSPQISESNFVIDFASLLAQSGLSLNDGALRDSKITFDEAKFNESIDKLSSIYFESVKDYKAEIINNKELNIDDVSITADEITVELTDKQFKDLLVKLLEAIKKDPYFFELISSNYNNIYGQLGMPELKKVDFDSAISDAINSIKESTEPFVDKVSVSTYVNRQGNVVGRSITAFNPDPSSESAPDKIGAKYIVTKENSQLKFALSVYCNDTDILRVINYPTSESDGKINLSLNSDLFTEEEFPKSNNFVDLECTYSNLKEVEINNQKTLVGKFIFKLKGVENIPINNAQASVIITVLKDSSIIVDTSYDDFTYQLAFTLDVSTYGKLKINFTNKTTEAEKFTIPSTEDAVNLTDGSFMYDQELLTEIMTNVSKLAENKDVSKLFEGLGLDLDSLLNGGFIPIDPSFDDEYIYDDSYTDA